MTRIQKQRLRISAIYCFELIFITLFGVVNSKIMHSDSFCALWRGWMIISSVILIAIVWMNYRTQKIVLTPEERQISVASYAEFNNRFEWKYLIAMLLLVFYTFAMLTLPLWIEFKSIKYLPSGLFVLLLFTCIISTFPVLRHFRNRYCIDGNILIIREYNFFRPEPELCIPIETVSEIYIKNAFTFFPSVYLKVAGPDFQIERPLHAISHPIALTLAIAQKKESIAV